MPGILVLNLFEVLVGVAPVLRSDADVLALADHVQYERFFLLWRFILRKDFNTTALNRKVSEAPVHPRE